MAKNSILKASVLTEVVNRITLAPIPGEGLFKEQKTSSNEYEYGAIPDDQTAASYRLTTTPAGENDVTQQARYVVTIPHLRERMPVPGKYWAWASSPNSREQNDARYWFVKHLESLKKKIARRKAISLWEGLRTGKVVATIDDVSVDLNFDVNSDYSGNFSNDAGTMWDTVATATVLEDITTAKQTIAQNSDVGEVDAYMTSNVPPLIMQNELLQTAIEGFASMKDKYAITGEIPKFQGVNWNIVDQGWKNASGTFRRYINGDVANDEFIIFVAKGSPLGQKIMAPCVDPDANGVHGEYAQAYTEKNPPAKILSVEDNIFYAPERVEGIYVLRVKT